MTRIFSLKKIGVVAAIVASIVISILPAHGQKILVTTISQIGQPLSTITGDKIAVQTLMKEGVDPHLYRLTRSDVRKLVHADLIVYNGLGLEAQMMGMMAQFSQLKPVVSVGDSLPKEDLLSFRGNIMTHTFGWPRSFGKKLLV